MNESIEQFVTGGTGNRIVSSASGVVDINFYCFVVNSDAVVTTLYHNGDATSNVIDTYKLQGITLSAGALIRANDGNYFSGIGLSSGNVIIYKR
jgi:hypothetical protein